MTKSANSIVIVIYCNKDGDKYIERMTRGDFLQKLKDHEWGENPKFAPAGTVPDLDYFSGGLIVIDGDGIEPRPVQTVTEFTL